MLNHSQIKLQALLDQAPRGNMLRKMAIPEDRIDEEISEHTHDTDTNIVALPYPYRSASVRDISDSSPALSIDSGVSSVSSPASTNRSVVSRESGYSAFI